MLPDPLNGCSIVWVSKKGQWVIISLKLLIKILCHLSPVAWCIMHLYWAINIYFHSGRDASMSIKGLLWNTIDQLRWSRRVEVSDRWLLSQWKFGRVCSMVWPCKLPADHRSASDTRIAISISSHPYVNSDMIPSFHLWCLRTLKQLCHSGGKDWVQRAKLQCIIRPRRA